jgi:preprotein translocase subunit SecG
MEKIKALIAVVLFVATILFLNYEQSGEKRSMKKQDVKEHALDTLSTQKNLLRLPR